MIIYKGVKVMKKLILTLVVFAFGATSAVYAQNFMDYVSEMRGDTAVINDYLDMDNQANTLIDAISLDTDAPEGRVYELKRGGLYWQDEQFALPDRPVVIVGADAVPMATGGGDMPPIICGTTDAEGAAANSDLLQFQNDLTVKNAIVLPAATNASQGWTFFTAVQSAGNTINLDNVLMEHTNWVFVQSNAVSGTRVNISDSYFVNMSGHACRRNGGVYDNVSFNTHTVTAENSTHIMASGMMYKFRNYPINRAFFNHNTFVNCTGQLFTTFGYQVNWTVTNNLFVNSNVQAYKPGLDVNETDQDLLPMGIINVDTLNMQNLGGGQDWVDEYYDGEITPEDRKVLVDLNGVYWDDQLDQIVEQINASQDTVEWVTQMLTMNSRTQEMFNADDAYPYLTEGTWIMEGPPEFTEPAGLMTDMVDEIIEWSVNTAAPDNSYIMEKWRTDDNPADENYTYPDWPVAADLSYSNEAYLNGGMSGFPLGDLNWFPEDKAAWEDQMEDEHAALETALNEGRVVAVEDGPAGSAPSEFTLAQNYPNPFNPTTNIQFDLPRQAEVTLEIYDITGQKVKTLVDKSHTAGQYTYTWNATDEMGQQVSSGIYIYRLEAGDAIQSKRMTYLK